MDTSPPAPTSGSQCTSMASRGVWGVGRVIGSLWVKCCAGVGTPGQNKEHCYFFFLFFFYNSHSERCEVISISLRITEVEHLFMCLQGIFPTQVLNPGLPSIASGFFCLPWYKILNYGTRNFFAFSCAYMSS